MTNRQTDRLGHRKINFLPKVRLNTFLFPCLFYVVYSLHIIIRIEIITSLMSLMSVRCWFAGWLVGRCVSVGRLVSWSVCHNFLKGWDVTLPCLEHLFCSFGPPSLLCCPFVLFSSVTPRQQIIPCPGCGLEGL